jgi:hypothetical protein
MRRASAKVQRLHFRPFGRGEQASAINLASAAPSKKRFLAELGECLRVRAASRPSSTSCWRVRAMVSMLVSSASAIWAVAPGGRCYIIPLLVAERHGNREGIAFATTQPSGPLNRRPLWYSWNGAECELAHTMRRPVGLQQSRTMNTANYNGGLS